MIRGCLQIGFILILASGAFADNMELRARFTTEAPKCWSQAEENAQHLDIVCTQRQLRASSQQETQISLKVSGECSLQHTTLVDPSKSLTSRPDGKQTVACRNSSYSFSLEKGAEARPWFITFVGGQDGMHKQLAHIDSLTLFPFFVFDRNVMLWLRSSSVTIKDIDWDIRPDNRSSDKLVAVTFSCAKNANETYWIHDGILYFNPDRLWAIQEFTFAATNAKGEEEHASQVTTFQVDQEKLPLVKRSVINADTKAGSVNVITAFDRFGYRRIPNEEFTLSAFGLPEVGAPSLLARGRLWMVLVGAGIACVVLAVVIRRRGKES